MGVRECANEKPRGNAIEKKGPMTAKSCPANKSCIVDLLTLLEKTKRKHGDGDYFRC